MPSRKGIARLFNQPIRCDLSHRTSSLLAIIYYFFMRAGMETLPYRECANGERIIRRLHIALRYGAKNFIGW